MARLSGPGRDFNDQWKASRDRAFQKKTEGEGPWATDKYLERVNSRARNGQAHHASSDSCLAALALLGGLGWALSELAGRILA